MARADKFETTSFCIILRFYTFFQGALLSLSGGESYRSNLQTNEDGKITFNCLSPSEYFLRPMMKEYGFEPSSQIINVKEGATLTLLLK